jgi:co-chaperonin GroES (HSP10)
MIIPRYDNVLVKIEKQEEMMVNGLYRPETVAMRYQKATVVDVGPGKMGLGGWQEVVGVKKGDTVLCDLASALELEKSDTGEDGLYLCPDYSVVAKVE